jgi:hypothetical protein
MSPGYKLINPFAPGNKTWRNDVDYTVNMIARAARTAVPVARATCVSRDGNFLTAEHD